MTDSPALERFTTPHDPAADDVVAGHMRQIRNTILGLTSRNILSIVLTGGFGRGEGGVVPDGRGSYLLVNDYDTLVVTRRNDLPSRLWLRRRLKALEPALSRACGVRVDIACKTPRMLRDAPHTVDAYETAAGHKLLWGSEEPLERIRRRRPEDLPLIEAARYLYNRGAALLWARRMLAAGVQLDKAHWRFLLIAIQKARLSWGDALLLANRRYTARYRERGKRLEEVSLPDELDFLPDAYGEALRFKLGPDFETYRSADMPALLGETIGRHEVVWRWIETARGMESAERDVFWLAAYLTPDTRLRSDDDLPGVGARLYNLGLNLWRERPRTSRLLLEHPEERLARLLPLLLFVDDEEALPWPAMGALLGVSRHDLRHDPRAALSDRFIAVWHPGPPF